MKLLSLIIILFLSFNTYAAGDDTKNFIKQDNLEIYKPIIENNIIKNKIIKNLNEYYCIYLGFGPNKINQYQYSFSVSSYKGCDISYLGEFKSEESFLSFLLQYKGLTRASLSDIHSRLSELYKK